MREYNYIQAQDTAAYSRMPPECVFRRDDHNPLCAYTSCLRNSPLLCLPYFFPFFKICFFTIFICFKFSNFFEAFRKLQSFWDPWFYLKTHTDKLASGENCNPIWVSGFRMAKSLIVPSTKLHTHNTPHSTFQPDGRKLAGICLKSRPTEKSLGMIIRFGE